MKMPLKNIRYPGGFARHPNKQVEDFSFCSSDFFWSRWTCTSTGGEFGLELRVNVPC